MKVAVVVVMMRVLFSPGGGDDFMIGTRLGLRGVWVGFLIGVVGEW